MGRTRKRAPDREPFRSQEILRWAEEWRTLRAWERDLYEVQISVPGSYNHGVYGACTVSGQRLRVYYSPEGIAVDLSTLLHEMAHADTSHEHVDHGPVWRASLARAVLEVTGTDLTAKLAELVDYLPDGELLRSQVDYHVDKAVREWWRRTGNDLAYDLGRGWLHRSREANRLWARMRQSWYGWEPQKNVNTYVPVWDDAVPVAPLTAAKISRAMKAVADAYGLPHRYLWDESDDA